MIDEAVSLQSKVTYLKIRKRTLERGKTNVGDELDDDDDYTDDDLEDFNDNERSRDWND